MSGLHIRGDAGSICGVRSDSAEAAAGRLADPDSQPTGRSEPTISENATLGAVIRTLSASLDLDRVLASVVTLLSDATGCHGCFVYSLEGDRLVLRAASPRYSALVDQLSIGIDEGLIGWVARTGAPEMISEAAMSDPRMKVIPELEEERFQSLVAAPIVGQNRATIGVISLHTVAPREFEPEVLDFLVSSGSLIGGAIENAQKHSAIKRHVQKLKALARVTTSITACDTEAQLCAGAVSGVRQLFDSASCQIYLASKSERDGAGELRLAAFEIAPGDDQPAEVAEPTTVKRAAAKSSLEGTSTTFTASLNVADEQVGLLVTSDRSIAIWEEEDRELLRALANLVSAALERIALIERLSSRGSFTEMIAAIKIGDSSVASTTAAALRIDLTTAHAILVAQMPERESRLPATTSEHSPSHLHLFGLAELKTELEILFPDGAGGLIGDGLTVFAPIDGRTDVEDMQRRLEKLAITLGVAIGIGPICRDFEECAVGLREAQAAADIASQLYRNGGALSSAQLGAYRLLIGLDLGAANEGDLFQGIEKVAQYDEARNQRSELLSTLERYLAEGRKVTASARVLFIHPNTLRQRLARIEAVSGLTLADEDQLELALALKLVRLKRGIPSEPAALRS